MRQALQGKALKFQLMIVREHQDSSKEKQYEDASDMTEPMTSLFRASLFPILHFRPTSQLDTIYFHAQTMRKSCATVRQCANLRKSESLDSLVVPNSSNRVSIN